MRVACCLLVLSGLSGAALGAELSDAGCLPLTVSNEDGNYIVPGARGGVVYRRVDEQELRLDVQVPSAPPDRKRGGEGSLAPPLVIVIHGGGFTSGSRVAFVGQFLEMLAAAGYPWVAIDYRLGGPARAAEGADDVQAAVAFARCHARELRIDPQRIVLLGEDAGAALAARAATRRPPGVVAAILIGGLYSGLTTLGDRAPGGGTRPQPAAPRVLVVHGTADTEVPLSEAEVWCAAMVTDDAGCELLRVEGASHRAENWWPVQWDYKRHVTRWLSEVAPVRHHDDLQPAPLDRVTVLPAGLHKRIPYAHQATDVAPGPSQSGSPGSVLRTLDAWLPRDRSRPGPAVVLLHGGGWEAGDRVTYITPLFAPLAAAGLAWFSVDYRLTPAVRHSRQVDDLREAVAFIRGHARQFGIDPGRVVLVGESASAQLVTLLAAEDRTLAGVVSFYGVYDFLPMVTDAAPRSLAARLFGRTVLNDETRRILRQYSPLHQAVRGMPPILLIHGTAERLWEQGVRMAERLGALAVPHELIRLEGAPHGMENWEGRPEWQFYKARFVSWIQEQAAAHQRR